MTLALLPITLLGAFTAACLAAYGHWWPVVVAVAWAWAVGLWRAFK